MIFILRASIMHFYPRLTFEGYRNNAKKEFEENQNYIGDEELHQEPDHPSTFMKMVKERTRTIPAVNDERHQVLPSEVIWDGTIDRFEVFRNNVEDHYGQIGADYLFDSSFHNTSQLSNRAKKDKVKKVLALINEIQIQDLWSSDEGSTAVPPTKAAMVCKLAQIPPEIRMILTLKAKKWLLNERKRQQQEDDKMKKSLA
jgi:hypothetical protein